MPVGTPRNQGIRGIRQVIPSGFVLGRSSPGSSKGQPGLVPLPPSTQNAVITGASGKATSGGNQGSSGVQSSATVVYPISVAHGGTGLTSGTSGGVPAYTASGTMTSSGILAANTIVAGGGAGAVPSTSNNWKFDSDKILNAPPIDDGSLFLPSTSNWGLTIGANHVTGASIYAGTNAGPTTGAGPLDIEANTLSLQTNLGQTISAGGDIDTSCVSYNLSAAGDMNLLAPGFTTMTGDPIFLKSASGITLEADGTNAVGVADSTFGFTILGTTLADDANPGWVGEYIHATVAGGSAVACTSGVSRDIVSISLTKGDWDVDGKIAGFPALTTTWGTAQQYGWINSTSATTPNPEVSGYIYAPTSAVAGQLYSFNTGTRRFSLASTTTIYLSCQFNFGVSTMGAFGEIRARRVR